MNINQIPNSSTENISIEKCLLTQTITMSELFHGKNEWKIYFSQSKENNPTHFVPLGFHSYRSSSSCSAYGSILTIKNFFSGCCPFGLMSARASVGRVSVRRVNVRRMIVQQGYCPIGLLSGWGSIRRASVRRGTVSRACVLGNVSIGILSVRATVRESNHMISVVVPLINVLFLMT